MFVICLRLLFRAETRRGRTQFRENSRFRASEERPRVEKLDGGSRTSEDVVLETVSIDQDDYSEQTRQKPVRVFGQTGPILLFSGDRSVFKVKNKLLVSIKDFPVFLKTTVLLGKIEDSQLRYCQNESADLIVSPKDQSSLSRILGNCFRLYKHVVLHDPSRVQAILDQAEALVSRKMISQLSQRRLIIREKITISQQRYCETE